MGFSQAELAERVSVSTEFVSRMERGKTLPSLETFVRLRDVLGCSADDLLDPRSSEKDAILRRLDAKLRRVDAPIAQRAIHIAEAVIDYETTRTDGARRRSKR